MRVKVFIFIDKYPDDIERAIESFLKDRQFAMATQSESVKDSIHRITYTVWYEIEE